MGTGKISQIVVLLWAISVYAYVGWAATPNVISPKAADYAASNGIEGQERDGGVDASPTATGTESRVTISVGETNGFYYTVNGVTYSPFRIAVSGEYFNNELLYTGYAHLFLGVDSGIYYYWIQPQPNNVLQVYVQNYARAEFFFEVISPYPVSSLDLRAGQYNATAILVTGPSRSAAYYPRASEYKGSGPGVAGPEGKVWIPKGRPIMAV